MRNSSKRTTRVTTEHRLAPDIGVVGIHVRSGDSDDAATFELGAAVIDVAALEKFVKVLRAQSSAPRTKKAR